MCFQLNIPVLVQHERKHTFSAFPQELGIRFPPRQDGTGQPDCGPRQPQGHLLCSW
ncbi:uncharacterized protein LOC124361754 isoform X5 [Homalodisca vitripennis]|uniref:uncharacterized protein LOC124361754 isoform X5 n=1 Tax=Homalodisca vitripennis TaxID=197043 RepID=UPI001EEC0410|nr:uncharacterized protein LOC124361754 isoform X5 [Homalodisca vitripennis]